MKSSNPRMACMRIVVCFAFAVGLFVWLRAPTPAWADGVVTDCTNYGQLSSLLPLGGTITFNCGGPATVVVTSTNALTTSVTIDGWNNGSPVTLSGNNARRVFSVNAGVTLNLNNLTVTAGRPAIGNNGGNISNAGTLILSNVTVSHGEARTSSIGNGGLGGGIYNTISGTLTINSSTIYSNTATENILSASGGSGGGIYSLGMLNVTNSTLSANRADVDGTGGGISIAGGSASLLNVTLANNSAGVAGDNLDATGSVSVHNTMFAGGTSSGNCSGAFTSQGHNLSDDTTCASLTAGGDMTNTPANLGPLQNNGGQTWTHIPGSAAVNSGDNSGCPGADQRGVLRPQPFGGLCDIGSVEVAFPASVGGTNPISRAAGTASFALTVFGGNFNPGSVVLWNGSPRGTTFDSPNQLTASILASDLLSTGTVTISVQNPGTSVSNAVNFTVFEGSDTVSQCNEYGLDAALFNGGNITFTCAPATITVSNQKVIRTNTTISGGNQIDISGGGTTGIFNVTSGVTFTPSNLRLINGDVTNGCLDGGAIHNLGTLIVVHVIFNDNLACNGGAIWNGGDASLSNSSFFQNTAKHYGGAIDNYGTLSITLSSFFTNTVTSANGGGINNSAVLTVTNSQFRGNVAGANTCFLCGGGALASGMLALVSGSTFADNSTGGYGGAILNAGSMIVLTSTLANNTAYTAYACCVGGLGGGIANFNALTTHNVTLSNNSARRGGGGLYNEVSAALLASTLISNTTPEGSGGGIQNVSGDYTGHVYVSDSRFISNTAPAASGGAIDSSTSLIVSTSAFTSNVALAGGGIHSSAVLTLTGSVLVANMATTLGGGLLNDASGAASLTSSVFHNNSTSDGAGGILNDGQLRVDLSTFFGNSVPSSGGGIVNHSALTLTNSYLLANSASSGAGISNTGTLSVSATTFNGNTASGNGGGVENAGSLFLRNSTFSLNSAGGFGGAIDQLGSADVSILNSTLVSNTASLGGGSLARSGGSVALKNTILAFSAPQNCVGVTLPTLGHNLESSSSCNLTAGTDQVNTNPLLGPLTAPPTGSVGTLTYSLLPGSPAIDAGDNSGCPAMDQRGVARPIDGNNDGIAVCDMGAYEAAFVPKENQTITFSPLPDRTLSESPVTVSATASSGLAVTFTASGACTVSGNSVNLTGLGTCTLTAHQAGNTFYNAAADVARAFKVIVKVFLPLVVR